MLSLKLYFFDVEDRISNLRPGESYKFEHFLEISNIVEISIALHAMLHSDHFPGILADFVRTISSSCLPRVVSFQNSIVNEKVTIAGDENGVQKMHRWILEFL